MEQDSSGKHAELAPKPITAGDLPWIADLNHQFESELSPLTQPGLAVLVGDAFYARVAAPRDGFLIALDQDADYGSPNFQWFRRYLSRFVYVDRIAIVETARGRGLAKRLYLDLFERARLAGHDKIVCEVNISPPNPASNAFHARLDFTEMGRAKLSNGKSVRYLRTVL